MELASTNSDHHSSTIVTPSKKSLKSTENVNPNVSHYRSPSSKSPALRSSKSNNTTPVAKSPQNRIRQRKFVVAKKKNQKGSSQNGAVSCNCKHKGGAKCVCVAYQTLRASQEEFFLKETKNDCDCDDDDEEAKVEIESATEINGTKSETVEEEEEEEEKEEETEGGSTVKRKRERNRLLEEARNGVPENGYGRVMHLVKAFERILTIPKSSKEKDHKEECEHEHDQDHGEKENKNKTQVMKWPLPGLQFEQHPKAPEATDDDAVSGSSFCFTSDLVLTSEKLGLDQGFSVSSSWDSSRTSISGRTSGARRSRRNSSESSRTFGGRWKAKENLKVTRQKPFKLRTEQRGKMKEEEFIKKVQEMIAEEQKMKIPIAQGLPWTTDEPECLLKPTVKESTRPIDLKLHSDIRAIDRAEFDQQVVEKMNFIEQLKLERERQQKLAEEEEVKRLRKELIPKAQPMPYFDRPFIPKRSMKHPTIPKEPKFHIPQHKKIKCLLSWNDMNPYSSSCN